MTDQRNFFRINDDVLLDYKVADRTTLAQLPAHECFEQSATLGLMETLNRIDLEAHKLIGHIAQESRAVADYLSLQNRKIDAIAKQMLNNQDSSSKHAKMQINLSEGGLAFVSSKAFYKGQYLAVRIHFLPDHMSLAVYAQVIRCQSKEDEHQIAVKFHNLDDQQRQILSKQILQAQYRLKNASSSSK